VRSDAGFDVRRTAVAPGRARVYDDAEWQGALVIVERGAIELEAVSGSLHRFARGDVLWLAGLALHALHNRGHEPAVLVVVTRRDEFSAGSGSYVRPPR
jgi:quercetin dioxygenase-like cupin family protein